MSDDNIEDQTRYRRFQKLGDIKSPLGGNASLLARLLILEKRVNYLLGTSRTSEEFIREEKRKAKDKEREKVNDRRTL